MNPETPLEKALRKMRQMLEEDEDDFDENFLAPSEENLSKAENFLERLYSFDSSLEIPCPIYSCGGDGGLRIEWYAYLNSCRFVFGSGGQTPDYFHFIECPKDAPKKGELFKLNSEFDIFVAIDTMKRLQII